MTRDQKFRAMFQMLSSRIEEFDFDAHEYPFTFMYREHPYDEHGDELYVRVEFGIRKKEADHAAA